MTAASKVDRFLASQEELDLLRFITCGSVDDGKSTLIGRLLFDSKILFEDHLAAAAAASRRYGTQGEDVDLALLVDGLQAEREQGITIDVAYRYFATSKRRFIVADTPGHEQYTRNMATGASTADLAVILVDARKGVVTQTRRHATIVSLLGIRQVLLAVNKMDLVDYDATRFEEIAADFRAFAHHLDLHDFTPIPISALKGDSIFNHGTAMDWYVGPTLLEHLETVSVEAVRSDTPFRFPVQWVNRPDATFRGFSGTIAGGTVEPGLPVMIQPAERATTIQRIVTADGDLPIAGPGQSVTLVLADEVDASRGDTIAAANAPAQTADQLSAKLIWMSEAPLLPHRQYLVKHGARTAIGQVTRLVHGINVDTQERVAASTLGLNDIARCHLALDRPLVFDTYTENRETGSFILIDRMTRETVGAGMIEHGLRRATNIRWQDIDISKSARAAQKGQKPCILWFTGLSGSGKSTIANIVDRQLHAAGRHTYLLDGDNVRHGLNNDLGFTDADRVENIRRVAEVAKLFVDSGMIVLVSFISPFRSERGMARSLVDQGEFLEVFMDTPLEVCESRDPKGLYRKARAGTLVNFTGIDSPYEPPEAPEIHLKGDEHAPDQLADQVIAALRAREYL